jgi:hypothetical protein
MAMFVAPALSWIWRPRAPVVLLANSTAPEMWYLPAVVAVSRPVFELVEWIVSVSYRSESNVSTAPPLATEMLAEL